jgi:hypothetical protein
VAETAAGWTVSFGPIVLGPIAHGRWAVSGPISIAGADLNANNDE